MLCTTISIDLTAKFHYLYAKKSESGVEVGNFGKAGVGVGYFGRSVLESGVGVGNFGKVGVGVGYFTSDSATLYSTRIRPLLKREANNETFFT